MTEIRSSRRAGDYALAMALVVFHTENGLIKAPRVGVGAVEATPRRIIAAEEILTGEAPNAELFRAAAVASAAAIEPLEDAHADAQYRRGPTQAMVYRALARACPQAGPTGMSDRATMG